MNSIYVVGCNGHRVSPEGYEALGQATLVAGTEHLLETIKLPNTVEKVVLGKNLFVCLPELVAESKKRQVAILASGDPLYQGFGTTLMRFVPAKRISFFPGLTAFQKIFAKLGQPWEQVKLFNLDAKSGLSFRAIFRSRLAAIYGDAARPAQRLARELIEVFPAGATRRAAIGCNLGFPEEQVMVAPLAQIAKTEAASAPLSVLVLLPDQNIAIPAFPLGLPDNKYVHFRNMITHPEVRAIALSKLAPNWGVMWDLGAGSGSVGLEVAGICPDMHIHAVERNPERFAQLSQNIAYEGIDNITAYEGEAETWLDKLPPPDRIFLGGGNVELLRESFKRLLPGGRLVATGVMVESVTFLCGELREFRRELLQVNISRAQEITSGDAMFWADNPILIALFTKAPNRRPTKSSKSSAPAELSD